SRRGRVGLEQVANEHDRRQQASDLDHEHHRVLGDMLRGELAKTIGGRLLQDDWIKQRQCFRGSHQNTFPAEATKCSTIGPKLTAGKKVRAPTIRITETKSRVNSGPLVGKVPKPGATAFFPIIEPAIARTGTIIRNRPTSMVTPRLMFHHGVFA